MQSDSARQALAILRDGSQFGWHVIPILLLVLYVYANEIERRNWNVVFAGLALWGMDWFNEIWNALILAGASWGCRTAGSWRWPPPRSAS
jgi:hypothetical protein